MNDEIFAHADQAGDHDGHSSFKLPLHDHSETEAAQTIAVAATFTADPLSKPLQFWMSRLEIGATVIQAPYAQLMQELLNPQSLLSSNQHGFNVLLVRLEDWMRDLLDQGTQQTVEHIGAVAHELASAVELFRSRSNAPLLVFFCPCSTALPEVYREAIDEQQQALTQRLSELPHMHCWMQQDLACLYPVTEFEDLRADKIGHIPYSREYFAALGTLLARRIAAMLKPQYKVIAIDCDNTLWKGVCGEDGVAGIELTSAHLALQRMLVRQHDAGVLLSLCSKNNPEDVEAVFSGRPEMPLRQHHIICSRVNWSSKSENLQSLAKELNLAIDSFMLIDDSGLECAEVRAHCAGVLTLQVPQDEAELLHFVDHVWAFDRVGVTKDAQQRTAQYRQNQQRSQALADAGDLQQFLASLQLKVDIAPMQSEHLARVAELVQRTNQFNLTAIRRLASEIDALCGSEELRSLIVHVRDRFGDYGLVGAVLFRSTPVELDVDTLVLSCRVLGRGVERCILNELGRIALADGRRNILLRYRRTPRNVPAWNFLEKSLGEYRVGSNGDVNAAEIIFRIPSEDALRFGGDPNITHAVEEKPASVAPNSSPRAASSTQWHEAAYRLSRVADVLAQVNAEISAEISRSAQIKPEEARTCVAPRTPMESAVAEIWAKVLGRQEVGTQDNFFALGGDSLLAVQVLANIGSVLGLELSIYEFFEAPTVEEVAWKLSQSESFLDKIEPAHRSGPAPLSSAQQRLWFIDRLEGGSTTYHIPMSMRLQGELDIHALQAALDGVMRRHEALRTVFVAIKGQPMQQVLPDARCDVRRVDLQSRAGVDEATVTEELRSELATPFDLSVGPLIRAKLLRLSADDHILLITMHHIVSDGWSLGVLRQELAALYAATRMGAADPLPPLPIQYPDYAIWQQQCQGEPEPQKQPEYWRTHLHGAPALIDLPTDRVRPVTQSYRGAAVPVWLGPTLSEELRALARRLNVTLAMTMVTAWSIVLARLSGQNDVVIGMPVANRRRAEFEPLIGFFVNTLAVRVRSEDDPAIDELLQRMRATMLSAYAHQNVPFERVVEVLQPVRSLSYSPVFQVMLAFQNALAGAMELPGLTLTDQAVPTATALFDLLLTLQESADGILGTLNYASDLFDEATVRRWVEHFKSVLQGMARNPREKVSAIALLNDHERRQVLEVFNSTQAPYPHAKVLHQLFEEQVERTPHELAVKAADQFLTYRQLNCRTNQLARCLLQHGVGPDCFVGLCVERGIDMVIGVLGILKAGGAYLPLDPNYPAERLQYMLEDARPRIVLSQDGLKPGLPQSAAKIITLDGDWSEIACEQATNPAAPVSSSHLAYVIYTSGSTGQPKGVAIEHRQAVNLICWAHAAMPQEVFEQTLHSTSMNFDLSVYECFVPLTLGGSLRVVENALALINEPTGVTLINTVPSAIKAVLDSGSIPATTRLVNLAGEPLKKELAERIFATSSVDWVCNLYGPSETTTYSTWIAMPRKQGFDATIGRPIANTQVYILDQRAEPVPIGVVGEIYIGGAGVARGYLNRPELTAERFLRDPFGASEEARMYKTGDLGRWRANGTIEYLGRNDHQVKIRGFRIELGEIEARLLQHDAVREVVVVAREDVPGDKRLVAYVVSENGCDCDGLRAHVKATLPEYMVPSVFVMLGKMPLTLNGKLDRRALPAPGADAYGSRDYEAPQGEVEEILAGIWQSLLRVERVGRRDNFFELGGHSLLIVQLMERLRQVGLATDLRRVFQSPTLADLASALATGVTEQYEVTPNQIIPGCEAITPAMLPLVALQAEHIERIVRTVPGGAVNIQDIYPLAPLQEGILFHHLVDAERGDTYVLPILLSVASRDRLQELIVALQSVIDRHDVLRTAVLWEELPSAVQIVYRRATLPVEEIMLKPDRDPCEQVREWIRPERQRLDIRQAPLMQLQVANDASTQQWYALLQLHHMTLDHATLEYITAEVVAQLKGRAQAMPESASYRSHVAQSLAYASKQTAETFFRSKLADIDESTAPFDLVDVRGDGTQIEEGRQPVEPDLARRVRAHARRMGVSAATVFHSAWALVLARTSGRDAVVFGSVLLGRLQGNAGAQRMLGMFINTLPLTLKLQDSTARELVEHTQRELIELLAHEQASLAVAQRCSSVAGSAPLFTTLLNYRHSIPNPDADWSSATGIRLLAIQERTNYPITMAVDDFGDGFALTAQTDRRIDPHRLTAYLHTAVQSLVDALEHSPHTPATKLAVLPPHERRRVIAAFNSNAAAFPHEQVIHQVFEEQVERTPDAVAVVYETESMTYRALNHQANQLARYLVAHGIGPDRLVGLCVERGIEMIVGLLGILKAGGAYVPLDASYPPERLEYMLKDSAPSILLTQQRLLPRLPSTAATVVALDSGWEQIAAQAIDNVDAHSLGLRSDHLAYVIYTSGSTGKPKGVMIEHANVLNLWSGLQPFYGEARRVAVNASFNFDASVQQFMQLLSGRTVHVIPEDLRRDIPMLIEHLHEQRIAGIDCTPSQLKAWLAEGLLEDHHHCVRTVLVGGEAIDTELWADLAARSDTDFFNVYGPTECTVDVTAAHLNADTTTSHIGRPMPNRRVYILDHHGEPVPIGVSGEIFIGGWGVGRGYLNRAELTAERFIADPFVEHRLARMYKTGDIGRWRADGSIEYLGRNDDQVKIRGYRIELGEVEAQLASHEHVRQAVVMARADANGDKRLVAYLVPREGAVILSADALRAHMKEVLPEYMVPSAFVALQSLPLTPSGKLDRRALPAPDLMAYGISHEPPEGDVEVALAEIWRKLLHVEHIGREDSFFELGGHSLLVLKALGSINQRFQSSLRVTDVYKSPTLRELAARISGNTVADEFVDLAREAVLDKDIVPIPGVRGTPAKAVLLTGATGFVGRFLLVQLLNDTDATVYCLVRAQSQRQASLHLRKSLAKWDLWRDHFGHRVVAVLGDLRSPRLGLEEGAYQMLSRTVDTIYHCATSMNHLETYAMANAANVQGAKELLRLAVSVRPKMVNYVSTLSVFSAANTSPDRVVDERSSLDFESHLNSNGYVSSKWVSDKLFVTAGERGIPCNIFRLGLVWADSQGRFDELQHVSRVLKTCLLSGAGIENYRYPMPPTPVDYVAHAVVFLANKYCVGRGVFHISASRQSVDGVFERCSRLAGVPLQLMSYYDWICNIRRLHHAGKSLPAVPLIEFAFALDEEAFNEHQRRSEAATVHFDCTRTQRELERADIPTPVLNDDLLQACINGMLSRDPELRHLGSRHSEAPDEDEDLSVQARHDEQRSARRKDSAAG